MAGSQHPPNDNDPDHTPTIPPSQPKLDGLFRAVRHPERRQTLRILDRTQTLHSVDELARKLAETPIPGSQTDPARLTVSLEHRHLPLLGEVELIEQTADDHIVATDATADAIHVLETATEYFN